MAGLISCIAVSSLCTILDSIESWLSTPGVNFGGAVLPLGALPAISGTELPLVDLLSLTGVLFFFLPLFHSL